MRGAVPATVLTVPVLPIADLAAAAARLRALGFNVPEPAEPSKRERGRDHELAETRLPSDHQPARQLRRRAPRRRTG